MKSLWKTPKGNPNFKMSLRTIEEELSKVTETLLNNSNLTKEEWQAIQCSADDRSIATKKQIRVILYLIGIE